MRYPPEHKEQTRRKIVEAAARLFRERGPDAVALPDIMQSVGLTIGGFYRHFESKDELFQLALEHAMQQTIDLMNKKQGMSGREWLAKAAAIYLHPAHRANLGDGCPLPMLTSDIARRDAESRARFETLLEQIVDQIEARLPDPRSMDTHPPNVGPPPETTSPRQEAWGVLATLVGGLLLSRGTADEELAEEILSSCRAFLKS